MDYANGNCCSGYPNCIHKPEHVQARELGVMLADALKIFDGKFNAKETEVMFRYNAIRGILLIAFSDVHQMRREWLKDL